MACRRCNNTGTVQSSYLYNGRNYPSITVCPHCLDYKAYSEAIKGSMSSRLTQDEILEERRQAKFSNQPFLTLVKGDKL